MTDDNEEMTVLVDDKSIEVLPEARTSKKRAPESIAKQPKTRDQKEAIILDLHMKGYNSGIIGKAVDMQPSTVRNVIQRLKPMIELIELGDTYKNVKADLLRGGQFKLLRSALSESKLKKAPTGAAITAMEKLHRMERLERGQSTENHAHQHLGTITLSQKSDVPLLDHENGNSRDLENEEN